MNKLLYAVTTGLVGAVVLHIIIILSLPHYTGRDAYTRVKAEGNSNRFYALADKPDTAGLANGDPYLKVAVCHFDVERRPLRLLAPRGPAFWSLALYDANSNEIFSMNDRTSVSGNLDVLVANPVQMARIRKTPVAALTESIIVEAKSNTGYAVLRAMAPQSSLEEQAASFLEDAVCAPVEGL